VLAGRRTADQQRIVDPIKSLGCRVTEHPYLEHREMLRLFERADSLCALLSPLPGAERVVPAKIFEYMAARRPILTIAPRGEIWELLGSYPAAHLFEPGEVDAIAGYLEAEIERAPSSAPCTPDNWLGAAFHRRSLAGELAAVLDLLAPPRTYCDSSGPGPLTNSADCIPGGGVPIRDLAVGGEA
jgi:hypothetical protein